MQLIRLEELTALESDTAVCLGTFDGVHLGHQALLRETVRAGAREGLLPCAYTFDQPPASVLGKGKCQVLSSIEEKAALLGACGMERVIYSRFDESVAACPAERFFQDVLVRRLRARHIVIGFHYHFGYRAQGDAALMETMCRRAGLRLTVVPPVRTAEGELVSSTAVRQSLVAGERTRAEMMLNRALSAREEALLGGRENE